MLSAQRLRPYLTGAALAALLNGAFAADDAKDAPAETIERIVVTASPLTTDPDRLATIAGGVDRDEILRRGGATLADALADIPGIAGSGFAAGASRPVIRGMDATRVRVLEDGIGSLDVSEIGPDHGVPIDPLAAQRIEVVRGPATLRYGSQAIGGVVNAINNRVPLALPDRAFALAADASAETNAGAVQGSAAADARAGAFGIHADAFVRHAGDYDIPGGRQANSYFRGDGASGGASYFFGGSRIGAAAVHYDATYGIPSDTTFIRMHQTKALVRSSFALDAGAAKTLTVDGGYGSYRHDEIDPASGQTLSTFRNREWDLRAETLLGALGPLSQSAVGVQAQGRDFSGEGAARDYLRPSTTHSEAAFAFTEVPLNGRLKLQLAGRLEHAALAGIPASDARAVRRFTPLGGSAGLLFVPTERFNLGLTLTSAARAPSLTELFARGPHDGPGTFETGDPRLAAERSTALEGTVHATVGTVHLEASLWGSRFARYIYGDLTGRSCDAAGACGPGTGPYRELLYRQRGATFWGGEIKATARLFRIAGGTVTGEALADRVTATLAGGDPVPRIPPGHVGAGLSWESERLEAGFLAKRADAQTRVGPGEPVTPGYTNLDAHVEVHPWRLHPDATFGLVARNLTDSVQRNAASFNKDTVTMPGRSLRLVLRAAL
jgi:iron complex outermembrane receptor protein